MVYFEVKKKFTDSINGYEFLRGEFIETDEDKWASRMGTTLSEVRVLPPTVVANLIKGSVEGKTEVKTEVKKEESRKEERPRVTTRVQTRAPMDKVVRTGDTDSK